MIDTSRPETPTPDLLETHVVMVVDDDANMLSALRRALAPEPYFVITSEHPKLALQWIPRRNVSVVISDRRMPEMFGDSFLREVRQTSPRSILLLLTAYPEEALEAPYVTVLAKPCDDRTLRSTVRRLLREREEKARLGPDPESAAPPPSEG
jgi:DNA-binding NtrC family response regulator